MDKYAALSKHVVEEVPGTSDRFPALIHHVNVNEEGTTDDMDCIAMVIYEVQDWLNDTDKYYISDIGILSQYWKRSNVMQMVRFTGL